MEFFRDRAAYGWNLLFPFMIIIGFSVMFNEDRQIMYKVGIMTGAETIKARASKIGQGCQSDVLELFADPRLHPTAGQCRRATH